MKPKTIRYKIYTDFDNYAFRSTLLNKLMWGDSSWKLEDLVNSALNYKAGEGAGKKYGFGN